MAKLNQNINEIFEEDILNVLDRDSEGRFEFKYIDIENIGITNRIRKDIKVDDLVKSIEKVGVLQPIVVAPTSTNGYYFLVSGYRRLKACAKLGIKKVPCLVLNKVKSDEISILEAMYNMNKSYTIKEVIEYINYLEEEMNISDSKMIEFLLGLEPGDFFKLKAIQDEEDPELMMDLNSGKITIAQAYKKIEAKRKKLTDDLKMLEKAEKAFKSKTLSNIESSGDKGILGDTNKKLRNLNKIEEILSKATKNLEELVEESREMQGFEPQVQSSKYRKLLDPALRKAVMERDRNTCVCCGEGGPEYVDVNDVHHIIPVFLGGPDHEDNLVCVCVKCHRLIHLHARGQLYIMREEDMTEAEKEKFKKIILYGNKIREKMIEKGMRIEELKKVDGLENIGRNNFPGQSNKVT